MRSRSGDDERRVAEAMRALRSNPRMASVVDVFARMDDGGKTALGPHGLMVDGRIFARFVDGTLVVKLPEERVAALVATRVGRPCGGRLRKWLRVTSPRASWIALAKEAHEFVAGRHDR